jgi:HEAT repeat protein/beta-lactamase regulating signal transducer with metallopeptidase domain
MNALLRLYPGDAWSFLAANVFVQVTVILLTAMLLSRLAGRWNAAWRCRVFCVAVVCSLAAPALALTMQASGVTLITLRSPAPDVSLSQPVGEPDVRATLRDLDDEAFGSPLPDAASRPYVKAGSSSPVSHPEDLPASVPAVSLVDLLRAAVAAALAVWLVGAVWLAVRWYHGLRLVAALRKAARPCEEAILAGPLRQVRLILGVERLPPIAVSGEVDRPVLIGLFRPLVILPEDLPHTLRGAELADILVHECAHAVCRHQVVGLLQRSARTLFWPHPLLHRLNRELARACEEVCDNYVLRRGDAPRYARTLLDLSQSLLGVFHQPVAIGLFHCQWRLEDRIADLLDRRRRIMVRVSCWSTGALAAAFLAVVLPIASVRAVQAEPGVSKGEAPEAAQGKTVVFQGKTLREWAVLTKSDDEAVEEQARRALREALPEAMPAVIELLKDNDPHVVTAAAWALKEMGPAAKPAVPALVESLKKQKNARSRYSPPVGNALRDIIGYKTTLPAALVDLLKNEDASVRRGAAFAVWDLVHPIPGEERTKDDPRGYYEVVDASVAIPILKELVTDKDSGVRGAAVKTLVKVSPESRPALIPVLVELLKDEDANVRWMAIADLRQIGPDAKAAVPALTAMIHDPGFGVRENIAEALELIDPEAAKAAVPALMDLLKDKDSAVQERTARVLLRLSPASKSAVIPVVLEMFNDNAPTQARAAGFLGDLGPDALDAATLKTAVAAMKKLLHETREYGNWCVRLDNAVALAKLDPESKPLAVSALTELLKDSYWAARREAAEALGNLGPDAKAAVPALTKLLDDRQEQVRKAARVALNKIQGGKG